MKEPNAIKLFVGQIPRDWTEKDLKEIFEPYGEIYRLNLLPDKSTGSHKGCAFLTYYENESAKKAQAEVHESRTLPGSRHPIQVKPAASETNVEDRTLYVGMLSKKLDENGIRDLFTRFGTIENLHILKNPDGKPKGCAFIKFETRLQAQNAIKAMNNSETMEGCTYPLVVKIADTEKDKIAKKGIQQAGGTSVVAPAGVHQIASIPGAIGVAPIQQSAYYQQLVAQQMALPQIMAAGGHAVIVPSALATKVGVQPGLQPQQIQVIGQPLSSNQRSQLSTFSQAGSSLYAGSALANLPVYGVGGVGGYSMAYPSVGTAGLATNGSTSDSAWQQAYPGIHSYVAYPHATSNVSQSSGQQRHRKDSPDGTNLFIYHLPADFNDSDLLQMFMPYGTVVSAKVYIDKSTGLSKCFGFVNYSSSNSANAAIKAMNGVTIGSKRLKVQLKRPKDQDRPY